MTYLPAIAILPTANHNAIRKSPAKSPHEAIASRPILADGERGVVDTRLHGCDGD